MKLPVQIAILVALLVVVTLIAELAGATNFGTALTFGVMAFMAGVVGLILKSP
jgi:hypothetical protein